MGLLAFGGAGAALQVFDVFRDGLKREYRRAEVKTTGKRLVRLGAVVSGAWETFKS